MKILNRGFIFLKPSNLFLNWANQFNEEGVVFSEEDDCEGSIYLIEEDFFEVEPILEKNFKKILKNEFSAVTEDETKWPDNISLDLLLSWFNIELGNSVFDAEKSVLNSEKLD